MRQVNLAGKYPELYPPAIRRIVIQSRRGRGKYGFSLGEGAKKSKKKLTSVSFAFTHTYTLEKLTLLLFPPKRTWKILKDVQNAKKKNISLHCPNNS